MHDLGHTQDWIDRCASRLQQQWRTVAHEQLGDVASHLWADERLRRLPPEVAAVEWLRQGIPVSD